LWHGVHGGTKNKLFFLLGIW